MGFWKGKRVLITGHSGFKGSWLAIWLNEMGAVVRGVSLKPIHKNGNFNATRLDSKVSTIYQDIRDFEKLNKIVKEFEPQVVFHLAAQSLVGTSYEQPQLTFETNAIGTLNMLEAIRQCKSVKAAVMITSDKCYRNVEQIWGYKETDVLGGDDPYSASKACAEIMINSYLKCYFSDHSQNIASCRAGNVVGGGDWSENRIVPDCFRALFSKEAIVIRNPNSTRPWQHVLEPLRGYLMLAERLFNAGHELCGSYNFGPSIEYEHTVTDVTNGIIKNWGSGEVIVQKNKNFHESALLQLDCTKARLRLKWQPILSFDEVLEFTTSWYKTFYENEKSDMHEFCVNQIKEYERLSGYEG